MTNTKHYGHPEDDKGHRTKSIALVGFMAAGKTTLGRRLAQRLQLPFVDLDRQIEQLSGSLIHNIFTENGEVHFRALEAIALRQMLQRQQPHVLATGGGTFAQPRLRALLCQHYRVVYLAPGWPVMHTRLARTQHLRPLGYIANSTDREHVVYKRHQNRLKSYRRAAHVLHGRKPRIPALAVQLASRQ